MLGAGHCLFNFRDYVGTTALGYLKNDPRLLFVTVNRVARKQYAIEGIIEPGCLFDRLVGGGLVGDITTQPAVIPGSNFYKYLHHSARLFHASAPRHARA